MEDKIIILGSGTCNIEIEKANTSLLLYLKKTYILYDFGYRTFLRIKEIGIPTERIEHIIISHFHPDHFSDLIPFLHNAFYSKKTRKNPITLYLNKNGCFFIEQIKKLLLEPPNFEKLIKIKQVSENQNIVINNIIFNTQMSHHFSNISIKFFNRNKTISITGDIDFLKDNLEFFKNSHFCFVNSGKLDNFALKEFKNKLEIKNLIVLHSYNKIIEDTKNNIFLGKDLLEFKL